MKKFDAACDTARAHTGRARIISAHGMSSRAGGASSLRSKAAAGIGFKSTPPDVAGRSADNASQTTPSTAPKTPYASNDDGQPSVLIRGGVKAYAVTEPIDREETTKPQ